jgi:hypothetical protein
LAADLRRNGRPYLTIRTVTVFPPIDLPKVPVSLGLYDLQDDARRSMPLASAQRPLRRSATSTRIWTFW